MPPEDFDLDEYLFRIGITSLERVPEGYAILLTDEMQAKLDNT